MKNINNYQLYLENTKSKDYSTKDYFPGENFNDIIIPDDFYLQVENIECRLYENGLMIGMM